MINLLGIHLTLLIGPTVPVPAPADLLEALEQVEVTHDRRAAARASRSRFQVGRSGPPTCSTTRCSRNPLLLRPFNRVILIVTFNVVPRVLMDGFITHQRALAQQRARAARR